MAIDAEDKKYSPGQIFKSVWDEDSNRIRVDAEVTATIGEVQVDLDAEDDSVSIYDATGVNPMTVNTDGSLEVRPLNSLVPEPFDYIGASYPDPETEIYLYKTGGAGGTTVATVTVVYVDSTKERLVSATRS
jgi:hypothetical protein